MVRIGLDDRSRVHWTNIAKPTDPTLDDASVITARDSAYGTAIKDRRLGASVLLPHGWPELALRRRRDSHDDYKQKIAFVTLVCLSRKTPSASTKMLT